MQRISFAGWMVLLAGATPIYAQMNEPVRLTERFTKDLQYYVQCNVEITGNLPMAGKPGAPAKILKVSGKSTLQYDERILALSADGRVDRTVRWYQQMDFRRKVGDQEQQSQLRPEVRRLVILRHNQYEVPFSPHGPLTWGEMDLVRTDVFVPALIGLLPGESVRVGSVWFADEVAVRELTDLEKIQDGKLTCTLVQIAKVGGSRQAQITFAGNIQGLGEDGQAVHQLNGRCFFNLDGGYLSYVSVQGVHQLPAKNGMPAGKIEGSFLMTRAPAPATAKLNNVVLQGLTLEPNADNTRILFEHPTAAVSLVHPRHRRVTGANDKEFSVDEKRGAGMLVSLWPAKDTPTGAQFLQATLNVLAKQQLAIVRADRARVLAPGIETFQVEGDEPTKQRVVLQYFTIRQGARGATIVVRMTPQDAAAVQADVDRMVRSLQLGTGK